MIFIIGSFWFWFLITVFIIILMAIIEAVDSPWKWSIFFITIASALLYWCGGKELFTQFYNFVRNHPFLLILYIICYLFLGVIWSLHKWIKIVKKGKEYFDNQKESSYYKDKDENVIKKLKKECIPDLKEYKNKLCLYIAYWPLSVSWSILNGIFYDLVQYIFNRLKGIYNNIALRIFNK